MNTSDLMKTFTSKEEEFHPITGYEAVFWQSDRCPGVMLREERKGTTGRTSWGLIGDSGKIAGIYDAMKTSQVADPLARIMSGCLRYYGLEG